MYLVLIFVSIVVFLITYLYLNPSIDNKDFDLEYKISNGKKKYDEDRNNSYSDKDYTFNHMMYCNEIDGKKLIIHSLDKDDDGKERVVFVVIDVKEKYPSATIDYLEHNNDFSLFKIKYKADSIFLWEKQSTIQENEELFFKGKRCSTKSVKW